jgi:DNA-directed RNA polymerase specialized sigma24 family protein
MRTVESIVREMPREMRQCYTLLKVFSYTQAQIAERLHMSLDDVEKNLREGVRIVARETDHR